MKPFRWDPDKNEALKAARGLSFESIVVAIESGELLDMSKVDAYELEILKAFEKGKLKSVATKRELEKFKAAARATAIKDRRVNIRLSAIDLSDIRVRALQEGVPYQTLIASVLHKYVSGRFLDKSQRITSRSTRASRKRAAG